MIELWLYVVVILFGGLVFAISELLSSKLKKKYRYKISIDSNLTIPQTATNKKIHEEYPGFQTYYKNQRNKLRK